MKSLRLNQNRRRWYTTTSGRQCSAECFSVAGSDDGGCALVKRKLLTVCRLPFVVCLLIFSFAACGKIGDPLPPIPRAPLIVNELTVAQQGAQLVLSFPLVRSNRAPKLQRVDIYRLLESTGDPQGVTPESFSTRAGVIASLTTDQLPAASGPVTYLDPLDLKSSARNIRYRYAVRLVDTTGQAADFSNYAVIAPLFDLAMPPINLQAVQSERQVEITWAPSAANESGSQPANIAAYNLYRRTGDVLTKLNANPLTQPSFIDRDFQFGATYQYIVRALSFLPGNASLNTAIESNPSAPLTHIPKDTFPPSAPTNVTIASINALVSIFWPLNSEPDVAGYNIYRATSADTPPAQWLKLNPQLHKTASFRDDRVEVGKQYFYRIAAVDIYGNESLRSEVVSETVNP